MALLTKHTIPFTGVAASRPTLEKADRELNENPGDTPGEA